MEESRSGGHDLIVIIVALVETVKGVKSIQFPLCLVGLDWISCKKANNEPESGHKKAIAMHAQERMRQEAYLLNKGG